VKTPARIWPLASKWMTAASRVALSWQRRNAASDRDTSHGGPRHSASGSSLARDTLRPTVRKHSNPPHGSALAQRSEQQEASEPLRKASHFGASLEKHAPLENPMTTKNTKTESTEVAGEAPVKRLTLRREVVRNLNVRTSVRTGGVKQCNLYSTYLSQPSHPSLNSIPNPQ
jgi:hypothetical protein